MGVRMDTCRRPRQRGRRGRVPRRWLESSRGLEFSDRLPRFAAAVGSRDDLRRTSDGSLRSLACWLGSDRTGIGSAPVRKVEVAGDGSGGLGADKCGEFIGRALAGASRSPGGPCRATLFEAARRRNPEMERPSWSAGFASLISVGFSFGTSGDVPSSFSVETVVLVPALPIWGPAMRTT